MATSGERGPERAPHRGVESVEALIGHAVVSEPSAPPQWDRSEARAAKSAPLRIYLGAAPGVGKTYAMLSEGRRRAERGTRVVVGCVETYGRPRTLEMLQGLETVAERSIEYRSAVFDEMDTDVVIQREPEIALVDELAHTNVPGVRRGKRWEDVIDLLAARIEVITTVNIQHLESLNDVVADVTGVQQRETVPDWVVELADQIELVDMSPHALRRRMLHGNVYPDPAKAELALQRYFTTDNLTALRELALMRVANQVDETLLSRWSKGRTTPETRERVLVCVAEPSSANDLVRRGARIAQRARGDFLVVPRRPRGSSS
jgi:two-component system sensor histidine kinase KdpD